MKSTLKQLEALKLGRGWFRCNSYSIKINPHHIYNFADYVELRFAIDNGITLCQNCHILFHKIYGHKNNKEQLKEFLGNL